MNIWQFNQAVMRWLLQWNIVNVLIGLVAILRGGIWRGIGSQNIGWGAINIMIAFLGGLITQNRKKTLDNPYNPAVLLQETRNMRRILQVNSLLDLLYIVGGWRFTKNNRSDARGIGIGIMIQGALLLIWDVLLLFRVPDEPDV